MNWTDSVPRLNSLTRGNCAQEVNIFMNNGLNFTLFHMAIVLLEMILNIVHKSYGPHFVLYGVFASFLKLESSCNHVNHQCKCKCLVRIFFKLLFGTTGYDGRIVCFYLNYHFKPMHKSRG